MLRYIDIIIKNHWKHCKKNAKNAKKFFQTKHFTKAKNNITFSIKCIFLFLFYCHFNRPNYISLQLLIFDIFTYHLYVIKYNIIYLFYY